MKKILPLIFVGLLASVLIFFKFNLIPKNLAFDEVEFAKLALSLQNRPYIPYSTLATGHSTLYFYVLLASLKLFGITTFALRLPAAIFGVLSVIIFYLVVRLSFRAPARNLATEGSATLLPFLLTLIFLSSRWFLNFARFSFEATFLLFLELVSIYFLVKAMIPFLRKSPGAPLGVWRSKKTVSSFYIIFSGIFSGFAFLSYTPGRIFFLLPLGFLLFKKQFNNETIRRLLLFLIPFIIITSPLTSYLLTNKDTRIDQQFFLKNHEMPIQEKLTGLWHNVSSTALMFNIKGDVNGRHNYPLKPALNPILGILFIIGLTISIKNWKKAYNLFAISYLLLAIFPALMTYPWENPNMLRTYTVLPSVVFFVGIAIYNLNALARRSLDEGGVASKLIVNKKKYFFCFLFIVVLFSSFYELRTYFKYQSAVFNQSFEIKLPLEKAIKVKPKS